MFRVKELRLLQFYAMMGLLDRQAHAAVIRQKGQAGTAFQKSMAGISRRNRCVMLQKWISTEYESLLALASVQQRHRHGQIDPSGIRCHVVRNSEIPGVSS